MGNNVLFEIDEVQLIFGNSLFCSPWMNFKLVWFPIFPGCSTTKLWGMNDPAPSGQRDAGPNINVQWVWYN